MGRKTWDSIPPKFRPLKDRHNIVISRALPSSPKSESSSSTTANSLSEALEILSQPTNELGKAFIIGGAQIYTAALEKKETKRILLTRILSDFECDTFFPVTLPESGETDGWRRRSKEELDAWTEETVPEGEQEENGTKYVFEMWERVES